MKKINLLFAIALCIISTNLVAQNNPDAIIGLWDTEEAQVEIYKEGNKYLGNPINSKGERNMEIEVLNLEYENDKWVGKIYAKKRGRLLDVACQVEGNKLLLEASARFISVDLEWQKIK